MNKTLFDQATIRYNNKDYRGALRGYTACLQDTSVPFSLGEVGLIYHRIGNCLVKLKNPTEAIRAYAQAASDDAYDVVGALENNIGMAYASLRDYNNAKLHFRQAVEDPEYDTPYKAYMGLGNAELKLGNSAEAGVAFREAALDEENPDPAKALLNLGICFMALDRPQDAIASYQSAEQFDMSPDTANRLHASMGQAYAANGQMAEAAAAFDAAISDGTYLLSDSASVDYQRALAAVAHSDAGADMSGLDVAVEGDYFTDADDPFFYDEGYEEQDPSQYPGFMGAYSGNDDSFFEASDAELEALSKNLAKKDRKRRNIGLKILVAIIVVIVVLLGAAIFGYTQGLGYPTQDQVVEKLFQDPEAAATSGDVFIDTLSEESIKSMCAPVISGGDIQIDGVNKSMTDSVVYATAKTEQGGSVTYRINMVRDLIGWKVSSIELFFPSQA